ncbi:MAG: electron transport complex subunit RsxC [Gammaproteobacteria bacterium]
MSRRIWDIPGGIHPPENKKQSSGVSIRPAGIPERLYVPVQQHIGAPAKPIVHVGDKVLKGQKIAEATGFVSLPVHAPTSGVVEAIGLHPVQHPSQIDSLCITIKTDGEDRWIERQPLPDYRQQERKAILERIRDAGIAGMGGAGFPSVVKLGVKPDAHIEQLILNAVECEPYITADDRLMQERADQIVAGLEIMAWLINPKEILIGIEDNKPIAIDAMRKACAGKPIEVVVVPTKYPSGGEKQLIHLLTGKEVHSGGLPSDVGVVCQNTGTAYAVKRAVIDGEPLISRITTLTGDAIANKGNYEVLLGTPVADLLQEAGLQRDKMHRLVMGGPMMGFSIHDPSVPVVKTTNCLLAPSETEFPDPAPEQPCIRCGACAQACPVNLLPQQLYWFSKAKEFEKAAHFNLFDCIECGACAYVCPSSIPLVQYYRFSKGAIRTAEQEARKSDHARIRFEARKARHEKEEQEKELKRQERAKAAAAKQAAKKDAPAKPAPVAAAPAAAAAPTTDAAGEPDELTKLQTAAASTMKRYKDAQKALETAEKAGSEHIDALRKKVDQLKAKADAAKDAFIAAKNAAKSEPEAAKPAASDDPMAALKQASVDDFNAYKAAEAALQQAESDGTGDLDALRASVAELKAKSDASKAAMKEARAKEKEDIQARNAAADPVKQAKLEAAKTQVLLKKARKALEAAQASGEGDIAALTQAVQDAEAANTQAEDHLKQLEGA